LPSATPKERATAKTAGRTTTRRSPATTPRASRSRPAGASTGGSAQRPVTQRKRDAAPRPKTAAAPRASRAHAPRGQNKAKILESLKAGPKTASEIAKETGIGTGTVSATLTKLATAGGVVKADRGYGLPK
jgi:predicted Rossmann fold nucleotide-binding protein DprA/Smf involved in DNA uptake